MLFCSCTLNELVSASIQQEDACCARMEKERKKRPLSGSTGALHQSTAWSTPLRQASCVAPLHHSSGAIVHLSKWHHTLQSNCSSLLHLELHSLLGQASLASTAGGLNTSLESEPSLNRATLLGPRDCRAVSRRR
jgi:hypothetical protein